MKLLLLCVLDLNYYSGIYYESAEDNNVLKTGGDGVHPSPLGHSYMAETIVKFLLDNPVYVSQKEAIEYLNEKSFQDYSGSPYIIAIEAMEKEMPMKYLKHYDNKVNTNWCLCPVCCKGLGWEHNELPKFCPDCGCYDREFGCKRQFNVACDQKVDVWEK